MRCQFAVRIVDIDQELTKPHPELDPTHSPLTGKLLSRVPIIRVFGSTPRGQKACVHVHGVFRYFLVPFDGELPSGDIALRAQLQALADEVDSEMANMQANSGHRDAQSECHVYDMSVVMLTPFYGYHEAPRAFVRVEMALPHAVEQASKLFARGFRSRLPLQPHEAHAPYLLQFKVDYNLLGMDFMRLAHISWRGLLPRTTAATELQMGPDEEQQPSHLEGSQALLSQPGFCHIWRRGSLHGMDASSPLDRLVDEDSISQRLTLDPFVSRYIPPLSAPLLFLPLLPYPLSFHS